MISESPERERLLQTATDLFYRHGLMNVGINRIIGEANIARMTLYNNFRGKTELILECLRVQSRRRVEMIESALAASVYPEDKLRAFFGVAERLAHEPVFRGCCFINAALQTCDPEDVIHGAAQAHKASIRSIISKDILAAANARNTPELSQQILALWDGAIVESYIQQSTEPVQASLRAALTLLRAASGQAG